MKHRQIIKETDRKKTFVEKTNDFHRQYWHFHSYLYDNYSHEIHGVRLQIESGNSCLAAVHVFFIRNRLSLASAWMFLNISSNPALNVSRLDCKKKGCLDFVRHVMDIHSIFLLA